MVPSSGDEFTSFLDLPDLDIDFANFEGHAGGASVQDDQSALKSRYGQGGFYAGDAGMRDDGMLPKSASATDMHMLKGRISGLHMQPGSLSQAEQHAHMGQQPMQFHNSGRIPPTPSSLDIHGSRSHFAPADPQQKAMFEAHMRKQQEQVSGAEQPMSSVRAKMKFRWSLRPWVRRLWRRWTINTRCPNTPFQVNTSVHLPLRL